jgi:glycosyltransferase involved in cell wall biosynthesis
MRITYVTHTRFPTEKAHGYQVAQVCAALADVGHEVTLVTPTIWNAITDDAFTYYGLPRSFVIQKLPHFDAQKSPVVPGFLGFAVSMMFYARSLKMYLHTHDSDLLYIRSPFLLSAVLAAKKPVILEVHALPKRSQKKFTEQCNRCALVVCLTSGMKEELLRWGVDASKLCIEADGVDLKRFQNLPTVEEAKATYGLPADRIVLGYSGSLVTHDTIEKGVSEMIQALALLKHKGSRVFGWIIGGPETWKNLYEEKAREAGLTSEDIRFEGRVPAASVPQRIAAFDVCVYPAPKSDHPFFTRDTSPLKLFEYLASRRPVVSADLPPLRDVVDESTVTFCVPGNPESLAEAIERVLGGMDAAQEKTEKAYGIAVEHTWEKRMERILKQVG